MKRVLIVFLCLFMFHSTAFSTIVDGEYQILKGEILELKVSGIKRLLMYEQGILDVVSTKSGKVELMGADQGETIVEIGTKTGKRLYKVTVIEKDMDEIIEKIRYLLHDELRMTDIDITKNVLTNRILLSGDIEEEEMDKIDTLLGDYTEYVDNFIKKQESEDIVEVDVEIVEVNKTRAKNLGIRGFATSGQIGVHKSDLFTFRPFFDALDPGSYAAQTLLSGSTDTQGNSSTGLWLDFLIDNDVINVLSRPRVACISGKEASLSIGGSVPILTTGSEGQTSVEYQDYGIDLSIAPIVRKDGYVELNLDVSVSEPTSEVTTLGSSSSSLTTGESNSTTASAPGTETRSTSTVVLVKDTDTLAISGLTKTKDDINTTKFPWLADVPVLGAFFRHKSLAGNDIDLMIMVTPKVKRLEKTIEEEEKEEIAKATNIISYQDFSSSHKERIVAYTQLVRDRILSSLVYPEEARRAGWEADIKVSVHLAEDGYVLGAKILDGSGHALFDDNLIRTIKEIKFFPKFPPSIKERELWLEVPFIFEIN